MNREPGVRPTTLLLRLIAGAALGISAYVHLHLASRYAEIGHTLTQADLFRIEGAAAILVAVVVLLTGNIWSWRAAALVGASSFGAVMLYRYVDVGKLGPIPNMYDATWLPSPDKVMSAIAEASLILWWLLAEFSHRGDRAPHAAGS